MMSTLFGSAAVASWAAASAALPSPLATSRLMSTRCERGSPGLAAIAARMAAVTVAAGAPTRASSSASARRACQLLGWLWRKVLKRLRASSGFLANRSSAARLATGGK